MTANKTRKGILKDMADTRDIYKLVKLVDKMEQKEEKERGYGRLANGTYVKGSPNKITVREKFTKRRLRRDRNPRRVETIIGLAHPKYIRTVKRREDGTRYQAFQVTSEGDKLLGRGFFKTWLEENDKFHRFIIALITGVVFGGITTGIAVWRLVKHMP